MQPHQLHPQVARDFEDVNGFILNHLHSGVPLVEKVGRYIIDSGGKRLRPLLALLSARACGYEGSQHINLAAIIEFIHTATLLHDDVVDTSDLRRGRSTANAKWGNAPSVLVGDFLYSRSFQMMVELRNMRVMEILSNATNVIAEGEVLQLLNCKNPDVTEENYLKVILGKTAMLFEAASQSGATIADASAAQEDALRRYGRHLGIAFQLIDDVMDYQSSAEEMGKNVGDDLAEGKPTLPLIHTMRAGTEAQRQLVRSAIRQGGLDDLEPIRRAVSDTGSIEYTQQMAQREAERAIACLNELPDSDYCVALTNLAQLAVSRKT
jgi:octaprenyl-diphosphate synthase